MHDHGQPRSVTVSQSEISRKAKEDSALGTSERTGVLLANLHRSVSGPRQEKNLVVEPDGAEAEHGGGMAIEDVHQAVLADGPHHDPPIESPGSYEVCRSPEVVGAESSPPMMLVDEQA